MSGTNPLPAGQIVNMPQLGAGTLAQGNGAAFGQGASNSRPLRGPPMAFVRQPYLGSPPQVVSISGFGTSAGAYVLNNGSDADQSQGIVAIRVGLNPSSLGNVTLYFPIAPGAGQYVAMADWSAPITPVVSASNLLLGWSGNRPLVTGELLLLAYQWAISN